MSVTKVYLLILVTVALWSTGLSGLLIQTLSPMYRFCAFWLGMSAPFWRAFTYLVVTKLSARQPLQDTSLAEQHKTKLECEKKEKY